MSLEKYTEITVELKKMSVHNPNIIINDYLNIITNCQSIYLDSISRSNIKIEIKNLSIIFKQLYIICIHSLNVLEDKLNKSKNDIINDNKTLFINKNKDYGNSFKDFELIGILIRLNDKINRLKTICKNDKINIDEKIEDTINDLYNYCVIGLMYQDDQN
jgi:hypothetical protein